jgi:phage-related minor tail protein
MPKDNGNGREEFNRRYFQDDPNNMTPHDCLQNTKFLEIAQFTGKIQEAVKNIKNDINVLFNQNRDISSQLDRLSASIKSLETKVEVIKVKFGIYGLVVGVIVSAVMQVIMLYVKKEMGG